MRMSGCPCLTRRQFRRAPTDALFADQSQSILDNLLALLRRSRAWNCSAGNCGCNERDQAGTVPKGTMLWMAGGLLSAPTVGLRVELGLYRPVSLVVSVAPARCIAGSRTNGQQ